MAGLRLALCLTVAGLAIAAAPAGAADRYSLAGGCYSLRAHTGQLVAKTQDGGYRAGGGDAEAFRMQATALGRYLLYGRARDFLAIGRRDAVPGVPLPVGSTARVSRRVRSLDR